MTLEADDKPGLRRVRINIQDAASGILLIVAGSFFAWFGSSYPMGTLMQLGPGVVPTVLGLLAMAIGIILLIPALSRSGVWPAVNLRPIIAVGVSLAAFALTIDRLGLMPATFLTIVSSAYGSELARPFPTLLLAFGTCVGIWLIFSAGLGMPVPLFGGR